LSNKTGFIQKAKLKLVKKDLVFHTTTVEY